MVGWTPSPVSKYDCPGRAAVSEGEGYDRIFLAHSGMFWWGFFGGVLNRINQ